jgi:hypothetical protein
MKYLRTARPVFVTVRFQGREFTGLEFSAIDDAGIIRRLWWSPGEHGPNLVLENLGARRSRWVSCTDVVIDAAKREKLLTLLEKREKRARLYETKL